MKRRLLKGEFLKIQNGPNYRPKYTHIIHGDRPNILGPNSIETYAKQILGINAATQGGVMKKSGDIQISVPYDTVFVCGGVLYQTLWSGLELLSHYVE